MLWPSGTDGQFDLPRVTAAVVTLGVGLASKNVLAAILSGAAALYGMLYLVG